MAVTEKGNKCYSREVAARLAGMRPQRLRRYEQLGLVGKVVSVEGEPVYTEEDVVRLRKIRRLTAQLGVNLAGAEVILRLTEQLRRIQQEFEEEMEHLRIVLLGKIV